MDACEMTEAPSAACETETASAEARMVRVKEFMVGAVMHGNEAADCGQILQEPKTRIEHARSGRFREGIRREDNGDGNLTCLSRPRGRPSRFRSNRSEHLGNHAAWFIRPHKADKIFRMKLDKHPKMW